jgi:hypothetical protein
MLCKNVKETVHIHVCRLERKRWGIARKRESVAECQTSEQMAGFPIVNLNHKQKWWLAV